MPELLSKRGSLPVLRYSLEKFIGKTKKSGIEVIKRFNVEFIPDGCATQYLPVVSGRGLPG
jgi:hypothetical protein